ncbi:MAG: hypothetical protein AAFZ52_02610 [Bacteroidota bacterium]
MQTFSGGACQNQYGQIVLYPLMRYFLTFIFLFISLNGLLA